MQPIERRMCSAGAGPLPRSPMAPLRTYPSVIRLRNSSIAHRGATSDAADNALGHREIFRALKPGGVYFGTYVNRWSLDVILSSQ
jgi:hypothetical protein